MGQCGRRSSCSRWARGAGSKVKIDESELVRENVCGLLALRGAQFDEDKLMLLLPVLYELDESASSVLVVLVAAVANGT